MGLLLNRQSTLCRINYVVFVFLCFLLCLTNSSIIMDLGSVVQNPIANKVQFTVKGFSTDTDTNNIVEIHDYNGGPVYYTVTEDGHQIRNSKDGTNIAFFQYAGTTKFTFANSGTLTFSSGATISSTSISAPSNTATQLTTARAFSIASAVTSSPVNFDGTANIDMSTGWAAGAVGQSHIVTDAVTGAKIASSQVTSAKLAASCVTGDHIKSNAITTGTIQDGTITAASIATSAVTTVKIADGAVDTTAYIQNDAVTNAKLIDSSITGSDLASSSIGADEVEAGAIDTTDYIQADTITEYKIFGSAVTNAKLGANSVTSSKIVDGQVLSSSVKDGHVTVTKIGFNYLHNIRGGTMGGPILVTGTAAEGWTVTVGLKFTTPSYASYCGQTGTTYGTGSANGGGCTHEGNLEYGYWTASNVGSFRACYRCQGASISGIYTNGCAYWSGNSNSNFGGTSNSSPYTGYSVTS